MVCAAFRGATRPASFADEDFDVTNQQGMALDALDRALVWDDERDDETAVKDRSARADQATLADVSETALAYLSHPDNGAGGNLHIVLDDGNVDDGAINFCYGYASAKEDEEGVRLACALLQLGKEDRDVLYANKWHLPRLPENRRRP